MRRLSCLIAVAAGAVSAASAAPVPVATGVANVVSFTGPPEGFDAVHAPDSDLAAYGFPPRPGPTADSRARRNWAEIISHARTRLSPQLRLVDRGGGPLRHRSVTHGASNSTNWSGVTLASNVNSYGLGSFDLVAAAFNVPLAQQAFGVCSGGWEYSSLWVGLDGVHNTSVFQAGTEADAYCNNSYTQTDYYAWVEWYPAATIEVTNLTISPGDVVAVWVGPYTVTSGTAFIINETTNAYVSMGLTAPAGTVLQGSSAEWILERPANLNNSLTTLANYVTSYMSNMYAQQVYGTIFAAMAPPAYTSLSNVTMTDTAGNTLSTAAPLGVNAVQFQDAGSTR